MFQPAVLDPRNSQEISLDQAVSRGIINQTEGTYVNPWTRESIPIPTAMNAGKIKVRQNDNDPISIAFSWFEKCSYIKRFFIYSSLKASHPFPVLHCLYRWEDLDELYTMEASDLLISL